MAIENDEVCDDLRVWMRCPCNGATGILERSQRPASRWQNAWELQYEVFASGAKTNSGQFYTDAPSE
jgi:hypothetical protein